MRVTIVRLAVAAAIALAALAAPSPVSAQGVDQSCELALVRYEPQTTNTLLLDTSATYWAVHYTMRPGTRLRIEGEYPYNRYISWILYDGQARPLDHLVDTAIQPDAGSLNPFVAGAPRLLGPRRYTAFVEFGPRPADPAPNTVYAGTGQSGEPNLAGQLWYRVYVPDRDRDIAGGVPLPRVTVEPAGGEGGGIAAEACRSFQAPTPDTLGPVASSPALQDTGTRSRAWGRNPPNWRLYVNLSLAFADLFTDNEQAEGLRGPDDRPPFGQDRGAGIFANRDISYVYAATLREYGEVLVLRGRAPTFPDTRPPAQRMPGGKQVRYFSMCQYEPASQRVIGCANDDRTVVDRQGDFTYVVSTAEQRPANAVPRCGVTWIPWGPARHGLLIYRHMLADPSFANAIQRVDRPGREREVMGPYYPAGHYLRDRSDFEALGCAQAGQGTVTARMAGFPPARRCVARDFRTVVRARGDRPPRRMRVLLDGRTIGVTERASMPVRVPARRLRAGRHRLTVVVTDAEGRTTRVSRVFRRCAGRSAGAVAPRYTG